MHGIVQSTGSSQWKIYLVFTKTPSCGVSNTLIRHPRFCGTKYQVYELYGNVW